MLFEEESKVLEVESAFLDVVDVGDTGGETLADEASWGPTWFGVGG